MRARKALLLIVVPVLAAVCVVQIYIYAFRGKEMPPMSENLINNRKPRIVTSYDDIDSWNIPTVVPFNEEQRVYVSEVILAMVRVIAASSTLEAEEQSILGPGRFRWPKNPAEPIRTLKSYFGENFRMTGITGSFRRESEGAPWSEAGLTVHPRNFPIGVYSMRLPSTLFDNFRLRKVTQEEHTDERIKTPLVFYFEHKTIENFRLKIEARDDVESIRDSFPSSFHSLVMTRSQHIENNN
jgi:hypothetical protein